MRREQRRQTAQSTLALRVVRNSGLGCVAPQLQTATGVLLRRALPKPKIEATRPFPTYFTVSKSNPKSAGRKTWYADWWSMEIPEVS